jgi:hypothetical protein
MARILWRTLAALAVAAFTLTGNAQQSKTPTTPRLYVFNGGVLASETARYRLTDADVEEVPLSVASFLIVHPRGVLLWTQLHLQRHPVFRGSCARGRNHGRGRLRSDSGYWLHALHSQCAQLRWHRSDHTSQRPDRFHQRP